MFNLEQAIANWRQQLIAGGIKSSEALDELEGHLREEVDTRVKSGANVEQAFTLATQSMGQPSVLQAEFQKNVQTGNFMRSLKAAILRWLGVPEAFSRPLTPSACHALELGAVEARGFHHDFIGTEHVLLGLLQSQAGVVPSALKRMGVDATMVRSQIERIVGPGRSPQAPSALPYTPRAKEALALAGKEAKALNQSFVGNEHIFLGLLREGSGVAAVVLKDLGVDIQKARGEIQRELGLSRPGP